MYVDDMYLIFLSNDIIVIDEILNWDFELVNNWFVFNKFILNVIKIEFMLIGLR